MEDDALESDLRDLEKYNNIGMGMSSNGQKTTAGLAPKVTIETVVVGKPWKVLSMLTSCLGLLSLFVCSASSDWLHTDTIRVGLWEECELLNATNTSKYKPCTTEPCTKDYAQLCAFLTVASLVLVALAALILGFAMKMTWARVKSHLYTLTIVMQFFAVILFVFPLVGYPFGFMREVMQHRSSTKMGVTGATSAAASTAATSGEGWHLGWAYYMGWVGVLILLLAMAILIKDRKSEEFIYRERIRQYEQLEE